jgi:hypothetical protein
MIWGMEIWNEGVEIRLTELQKMARGLQE